MLLNLVLEKTVESLFNCKEIKPVNHKGNQSWIFIGRTDAEPETPILWPPDVKNWLIGKDPGSGKDWRRQEEKGTTEDEMVGWYHQLDGHEFEQALGVGDGQGGLVCCSPWGCKESDTTKWLNWTERILWIEQRIWSSRESERHGLLCCLSLLQMGVCVCVCVCVCTCSSLDSVGKQSLRQGFVCR